MSDMPIELSLGPLLFNWPAPQVEAFYARIAETAPVDRVYLGEVVCGKRTPLLADALARSAERLGAAGKTVVWSSMSLPTNPRERRAGRNLAALDDLMEINDISALADRTPGAPFVAGSLLNVYNEDAARELMARGCVRLCANVELPLTSIAGLARACPTLELEVFAFGRLPLALSGRCYHARAHGRHRDTCQYVCDRDPDGMAVRTLDGQEFLAVNGVQTLSHGVQIVDLPPAVLREAGVRTLRLSPHTCDMAAIALVDGEIEAAELRAAVRETGPPGALVSGYLRGGAGLRAADQ
ncbi:MAG TPA: U32 family peptidase [Caulobacter sp.]|nr:U32 family peptidase [Caulobacter sp.]